jgi:cytochrome bd-type quinol oxidase subunit 2
MLAIDYRWWKFLHVLAVLGFVLFHGVSIVVAIRLRKERDRARIAELLQFSGSSVLGMYVSLGALIVFGVITGFAGKWWGYWWIWLSIALLVLTIAEMTAVAKPYYEQLKDAIQLRPSGVPRKSDEELDLLLRSRLALFNAVWGVVALVLITFLMIWKPDWRV